MDRTNLAWKKWTIVTISSLTILMYLTLAIIMCCAANKMAEEAHKTNPKVDVETYKAAIIAIALVMALFGISFQLVGLFGAIKEHFCLSVTYLVLNIISLISSFGYGLSSSYYFGSFFLQLILTVIIILFVRDLNQIRHSGASYA